MREYHYFIKGGVGMAYQRKTRDRWDIETNYGYGWEVENSEYTREDAKRSLREYRENCRHMENAMCAW